MQETLSSRPVAHRRILQGSRAAQVVFNVANKKVVLAVVHLSKQGARRSAQQAVDDGQAAPTARRLPSVMHVQDRMAILYRKCTAQQLTDRSAACRVFAETC